MYAFQIITSLQIKVREEIDMKETIKEKMIGLLLIAIGLVSIPVLENNCTVAIFAGMLGLYLLLTRRDVGDAN